MTENLHAPGESGARAATDPTDASSTRSLGEIVGDISQDLSTLIRQEMDLATSEMKREVTKLGTGAGMFGAAGATGYLMLFFASLALTYLLDNWIPVELAALIVAILWGIVAAVLALKGRQQFKNANPQLPVTQRTLKEDAQWAKTQTS